jgi:putative flippase GtrA
LINTVVGYAVIFACMAFGLGPRLSNALGYAVGFVLSFVQSRYWVFRSANRIVEDATRFVPAFLVAFAANFLVLQALLWLGVNAYLAQLAAGCAFIAVGFVLNYVFVFRRRKQ